jgi:beta-glucanase (GH16 family)
MLQPPLDGPKRCCSRPHIWQRTSGAVVLTLMSAAIALLLSAELNGRHAYSEGRQLDLAQYRMTFHDEFDDLSVSAWGPDARWIAHTPWSGDFGDAQFADPRDEFPFTVRDGILRIEARKDTDGKWQSGLLASTDPSGAGFSQTFGYFEIRAKLPAGPGLWPAFWLIANKDPKASAEIDIFEHYGVAPDIYHSVVHTWSKSEQVQGFEDDHPFTVPSGSLYEDFHTYGVDVAADWITFYLDRIEMGRTRTQPIDNQPFFILIDLALGGGWPIDQAPSPSFMYVDYVRVYERQ